MSFYWAVVTLLTVGYGDIVPKSNAERLYSCMTIVMGAVFYAVIFGNVSLLIHNIDMGLAKHRKLMDGINVFIKHYKVPKKLAQNLIEAQGTSRTPHTQQTRTVSYTSTRR